MDYRIVPEEERSEFLPNNYEQYLRFEMTIYTAMEKFTGGAYTGGLWQFRKYSNGAAVMVYDQPGEVTIVNPMNFYEGTMSWEAASIAVNAMVANWIGEYDEYYDIMDIVNQHPEVSEMYKLLD